jgi:hypothetical protein
VLRKKHAYSNGPADTPAKPLLALPMLDIRMQIQNVTKRRPGNRSSNEARRSDPKTLYSLKNGRIWPHFSTPVRRKAHFQGNRSRRTKLFINHRVSGGIGTNDSRPRLRSPNRSGNIWRISAKNIADRDNNILILAVGRVKNRSVVRHVVAADYSATGSTVMTNDQRAGRVGCNVRK